MAVIINDSRSSRLWIVDCVPPICIGDQVWVASDVFVAPGVTIGDGAVVGLRSTVLHDLPPGMLCYGNPAKPVKPREMKGTSFESIHP